MPAKNAGDIRILLVDDEAGFRNILGTLLSRKGFQVTTACNGREALRLIKTTPVDVVVSDILMPDGNGIELLDKTREEQTLTPVILLMTGFSDLSTEEAHDKGAEALFSKPFNPKVLEETIMRLMTPREERWATSIDKVDAQLKIELHVPGIQEAIEAKVINFGRGGMFVSLTGGRHPNVNETVSFNMTFEGLESPLNGSGIVRWARTKNTPEFPSGCGIEFCYLEETKIRIITDFISSRKLKAYIPIK